MSLTFCSSVLIWEQVGSSSSFLGPTAMLSNSYIKLHWSRSSDRHSMLLQWKVRFILLLLLYFNFHNFTIKKHSTPKFIKIKTGKKGYFYNITTEQWSSVTFPYIVAATLPLMQTYLNFNEDIRGQWSTVVAVWRAGRHSLTSYFPLWSSWRLRGDQLHHSPLHVPRVWSHWATHSLHHTIVPALPLSSYQGWWWGDREKILDGCP